MRNTKITPSVTALRQKPKDQKGSYSPNCSRQGTAQSQQAPESKLPIALTPSQQYLPCFWGEKEQDAPTSWNKGKNKKARYGFHISDCLQTLYLWDFSFQN